jgi:hypothetical protein
MSTPQSGEQAEYSPSPYQQDQVQDFPGYPPPGYAPQGYPPPGYPPPGYYQPVVYQQAPPKPKYDGLAITSMIVGIVWVYWIGSILAVVFGHIALRRIARDGKAGRGMAIAGLVLGYIGVATLVLFIVLLIASAAHQGSA